MTFAADRFFLHLLEAVINASLAVTLLAVLAWIILRLARPLSAAFRSFVWAATLGGALVVPLLLTILPPIWSLESISVNNTIAPRSALDYPTPVVWEIRATRSDDQSQSPSNTVGPAGWSDLPDRSIEHLLPIAIRIVVVIWFADAVLVLGRFLAGSFLIRARAHRTGRAVEAEWDQAIFAAARSPAGFALRAPKQMAGAIWDGLTRSRA
jgi:hypothetical protein